MHNQNLITTWQEDKIGNLLLKSKRQKKVKRSEYFDGGLYPIIDQGDNLIGGYTNDETYLFDGDLPMTIFGDHTRRFKYINFPFAIGADGTQLLVPKKEIDRRFFYYALKNAPLKNYGYQRHFKYLKDTKISFPAERKTQEEIVHVLGSYDDLIENNTKRIKILEEIAQAIYREWFVHFRFPGHEKVKMVEGGTDFGKIPEGWGVKKIEDVCIKIQAGGTPRRGKDEYWDNGTINWYTTGELQDNFLFGSKEKITERSIDETSAKIFDKGTILMAIYGSPTVGRLGITTECSSCNQAALGLVEDSKKITKTYLYYVLKNLREKFNLEAVGAAQQNISKIKVSETQCLVANRDLIDQFDVIAFPIFQELESLQRQNGVLRDTRDLFLPKLVNGEIRV